MQDGFIRGHKTTVMSEEPASSPADTPDRAAGSVRAVYDRIADHFASTRAYAWPEVESFVTAVADHEGLGQALDLGCGNGRHTELLAEYGADAIGVDVSRGLLSAAATRRRDHGFAAALVQGDAATLPFADATFDQIVYVATLHHLRPEATRRQSLAELGRLLRPGGLGLSLRGAPPMIASTLRRALIRQLRGRCPAARRLIDSIISMILTRFGRL